MIEEMIAKKVQGGVWSDAFITQVVNDYTNSKITDEEMTKWLKCICDFDLSDAETLALTKAQLNSGDILDLSSISGIKVDKHSTGGVGDNTTLIVGPIVASLGIPVAKMSGRALGHTGGTIDKLESIPGFRVSLTEEEFINQVNQIKIAITSQTGNLVPADKKIYALRDVTGMVKSIPLITASIMSKKLASGSDKIVLDVKVGNGAFCDTLEMADALAKKMVKIGKLYGKETVAIITDMNQPLGSAIGNSIEIREALDVLYGVGPADLREVCLVISSEMIALAKGISMADARIMAEEAIVSGKAYAKFVEMVSAQGGDLENIVLPYTEQKLYSKATGYVSYVNTSAIGELLMELGAGRKNKEDLIDYQVGIFIMKKLGDAVKINEPLLKLKVKSFMQLKIEDYFVISDEPVVKPPLIYKIIK